MPEISTELHKVQRHHSPHIKAIYALPDMKTDTYQGPSPNNLVMAQADNFTLVGPSIKLSTGFLTSISDKNGFETFSWVIDNEKDLRKAATSKLNFAVSNHPRSLNVIKEDLLRTCDLQN